jgi:hypothetical protein
VTQLPLLTVVGVLEGAAVVAVTVVLPLEVDVLVVAFFVAAVVVLVVVDFDDVLGAEAVVVRPVVVTVPPDAARAPTMASAAEALAAPERRLARRAGCGRRTAPRPPRASRSSSFEALMRVEV